MGIEVTAEGVGDENDIGISGLLVSDFFGKIKRGDFITRSPRLFITT